MSPEVIALREATRKMLALKKVEDATQEEKDACENEFLQACEPEVLAEMFIFLKALTGQNETLHRQAQDWQYKYDNKEAIEASWAGTNYR